MSGATVRLNVALTTEESMRFSIESVRCGVAQVSSLLHRLYERGSRSRRGAALIRAGIEVLVRKDPDAPSSNVAAG
jgi:hypothetical protein